MIGPERAVQRIQSTHSRVGQRSSISSNGAKVRSIQDVPAVRRSFKIPRSRPQLQFRWASAISGDEWKIYREAIVAVRKAGVNFLLGGGFALAAFTGRWRDTKDIDFYIAPRDRDRVVAALAKAGFADYYDCRTYDRKWIYRSVKAGVIVDIIWSMANQRAQVDAAWFARAGKVSIRGEKLNVVPMEEFLWCKLYIVQRDHCDWTDILNLIYARGQYIDWKHLIHRLDEDSALLKAVLMVYAWIAPQKARHLPQALWQTLALPQPSIPLAPKFDRIRLLDSRAWFAALQPKSKKLEV